MRADDFHPSVVTGSHSEAAGTTSPVVEVSNLLLDLGHAFALCVPDLRVFPGDMLAIIGANGSGKSTLLSCLLGTSRPHYGQVRVLGNLPARCGRQQRNRLGVQLQGAGYNDLYLVRDIQGLHRLTYEHSDASVFEAFGVPELAGKRFGSLSSGEQQRVQLAMALAHNPQLAFFDEPTSNLDPNYEEIFCSMLKARRANDSSFTCVFVTHAPNVVSLCERLMVLDGGKVEATGDRRDLVLSRFHSVGCRLAGTPAQLKAALVLQVLAKTYFADSRGLTLYGDEELRASVISYLGENELESSHLWRPGAADLLEAIKRV